MQTATLEIHIKQANPSDLKDHQGNLRIGFPYYLKSQIDDSFEGPYRLHKGTDVFELKKYLDANMVWVPCETIDYIPKKI